MVDHYFCQVGEDLDRDIVIGGPVYSANGSGEELGKIVDYIPSSGFAKLRLYESVHFKDLMKAGILIEHIIFKNLA